MSVSLERAEPLLGARPLRVTGTLRRVLRHPGARAGVLLGLVVLIAITLGPVVRPESTETLHLQFAFDAPSWSAPLGRDQYGRDELARILAGGRLSLAMTAVIMAGALAVGLTVGLIAGLAGGVVDAVAMRIVDLFIAIPGLVITFGLVAALGPGLVNLVIAFVVTYWAGYARIVRSLVLSARRRPDVTFAEMAGVHWVRAGFAHVLPTAIGQVIILASVDLGHVIVTLASLSFLGLGAQPPTPEWGTMLSDARNFFAVAPWLVLAPAVAIFLTALSANLIGEALRKRGRGA